MRDADDLAFAARRRSELIGRPLDDEPFLDAISRRIGRAVASGKRRRAGAPKIAPTAPL